MIEGTGTNLRIHTNWEDPSPTSERERLENILLKKQIGLEPKQALSEIGYPDAESENI